jgi:hypothetical protein
VFSALIDPVFDKGCVFASKFVVLIFDGKLKYLKELSLGVIVESIHQALLEDFVL